MLTLLGIKKVTKGIKSNEDTTKIPKKMNTPNTFAPLRPITPARVAIYPPQPTTVSEQRYGQGSGGTNGVTVITMILMILFPICMLAVAIWVSEGWLWGKKPSPAPLQVAMQPVQSPQSVTQAPVQPGGQWQS